MSYQVGRVLLLRQDGEHVQVSFPSVKFTIFLILLNHKRFSKLLVLAV